ncbi:hypothetical protein pKMKP103_CDS0066 [Klebsiella phage pKMKP103]|nr:hypothetical protein pKMKP103_CDS0066 [Klebsiella phage pKMKP103]
MCEDFVRCVELRGIVWVSGNCQRIFRAGK